MVHCKMMFVLMLTLGCLTSATFADDAVPTWEDVQAGWVRRAQKFHRYRVKWTEIRIVTKGTQCDLQGRLTKGDGRLVQEQDLKLSTEKTALIDGNRWRLDIMGENWNNVIERVCRFQETVLFDGKLQYQINQPEVSTEEDHALGNIIGPHAGFGTTTYPKHRPVFSLAYANHPDHGVLNKDVKPLNLELSPLRKVFSRGGRTLFELGWIYSVTGKEYLSVQVDPQYDFALVKVDVAAGSGVAEIDLDSDGQWPTKWQYVRRTHFGKVIAETAVMTVVSRELDPPVEPNEFRLVFPEKAQINEKLSAESPMVVFVQQANGERRVITADEQKRGAQWDEIVSTQSGQAALQRMGPPARSWGWSWAVGIVLLTGALLCWRRFST